MRAPSRLVAALAACAALAGTLVAAAPASAGYGDRIMRKGMEGDDVKRLQRKLTRLGFETRADGFYGRRTKRSMKRWERRNDRNVNGVCSRREARKIRRQVRRQRNAGSDPAEEPPATGTEPSEEGDYGPKREYASRRLVEGRRGTDVARLQRLLSELGLPTPVDGTFGQSTRRSMKKWEAWRYLRADGEANRAQQRKIRSLASEGARYVKRKHVFPVRGPHDYGGEGSRFGAPRPGRTHRGQDVAAAQGTPLVAVHAGQVAWRQYQAGGAGHYLVIHGRDGSDSVYMHMVRQAIVEPGRYVRAGERIGRVGNTGASYGAHLHFELWTQHWYDGGNPYDPLPDLKRWDEATP